VRFAHPAHFLWLLPSVVLLFLYLAKKIGGEATLKFSSLKLLQTADTSAKNSNAAKRVSFGRWVRGILRFAALVFMILALARPQTGSGQIQTTEHVVDIMIALDISGSMATLDFEPENRLIAAKQEAKRFIEGRPHDRIGLVVFAGQSVTQCPLTTDSKAILALLDKIQLGMLEDGTAIGLGIGNALNRLKKSEAKRKVVILLTDGVNNAGEISPLTAAGIAKELGIRVYTIGVGREGESVLPVQDPRFGMRLLKVQTEIDEKMLTQIAQMTGASYFRAQDREALRDIFRQIDRLEKTEITVENFMSYEERYFWFLWLGLFFLLAELVWANAVSVKLP